MKEFNLLEWFMAINDFLGLFKTDPEKRRERYIKKLQKQVRKGEITQAEYDKFLADYDKPK